MSVPPTLLALVAEEFFSLRVDLHAGAVAVDRQDRIGNGFQEVAGEECPPSASRTVKAELADVWWEART